jgi:DNA-binding cell septation regulator SpoVG
MEISVKWFAGQYPSFNLILATAPGKDPFLEVKGCRIVDGKNGQFVSWPATKKDDGKYWNHVYASDLFADVVRSKAQEAMPKAAPAKRQAAPAGGGGGDDDIPFSDPLRGRKALAV